ncbi:MAG: solute carrier family 13 (sodium-dependent dicarboxylate transporter), er 2/3/5 [Clostridia bacterium]|nr:solute carrier family 13 (sodium-dependent dicarboxylate transporter), er 2/3/5 [Clostridia bacterium]
MLENRISRATAPAQQHRRRIAFIVVISFLLCGFLIFSRPFWASLGLKDIFTLAVVVMAVVFWSTGIVDAVITSILVISLLPLLGVMPYEKALTGLGDVMLWRLIGILIITMAVEKTGLARRLAFYMLRLSGDDLHKTFFLIILFTFLLTFIVPVSMGRTILMLAIMSGILQRAQIGINSNIAKSFSLGIAMTSFMASSSIIVGATVEIYAAGLFERLIGHKWTYLSWMYTNLPVSLTVCLAAFFVLRPLFPFERDRAEVGASIKEDLAKLGPISLGEKKLMAILVALLLIWFTGYSDYFPAELLLGCFLFFPGIGILRWKEVMCELNWSVVFLYGAATAMAMALGEGSLIPKLVEFIAPWSAGLGALGNALIIVTLTVIVRLGMANMLGAVAAMLPFVFALAQAAHLNPAWLGMVCVIASTFGTIHPSQAPSLLIAYGYGYFTARDLRRAGFYMTVVACAILLLYACLYWPLIGLKFSD